MDGKFEYGKQFFILFRNLLYGTLITFLSFIVFMIIGLIFFPDKIQGIVEFLRTL